MKTVMVLLLAIILSGLVEAQQFKSSEVTFPEAVASDSFKVPQNYSLIGLKFDTALDAGITGLTFLTSNDGLTFDTLHFDGEAYVVIIPDNSTFNYSLDIKATLGWEWWKVAVPTGIADSITFTPIFIK